MTGFNHSRGIFKGKGSLDIFYQSWTVEKPKAAVIIAHGLGEHSGRYLNIVNAMKGKSVSFYALDHRGHGASGGRRGHVDSFLDYIHDLKMFVNIVKEKNSFTKIILLGHSLGGAIACRYALTYQDDLSGLILSSPGLKPVINQPKWMISLGKVVATIFPKVGQASGIDPLNLSHDKEVLEAYLSDPLIHNKITYGWLAEFIKNGEYCLERASELKLPLLIFQGTDDKICDIAGSERLYKNASSQDKQFERFDGLYHETMNELEKDKMKVLSAVSKWISSKISSNEGEKKMAVSAKKPAAKKAAKKAVKKAVKKVAKKAVKKAAKKVVKKAKK